MPHKVAPQAETELDSIWYHVAKESGSIEVADRLIDSITQRFLLLSRNPRLGRRRDEELRPGLRSFPVGEYIILESSPKASVTSRDHFGKEFEFRRA